MVKEVKRYANKQLEMGFFGLVERREISATLGSANVNKGNDGIFDHLFQNINSNMVKNASTIQLNSVILLTN